MNKDIFIDKIDGIGKLEYEKVFFESYYPILFTCRSDKNVLYLCVCCQVDSRGGKWLITNINPDTVIAMLNNKITIREAFLKDSIHKYTIDFVNGQYSLKYNDLTDWDSDNSINLPTPGEYMDSEEGEFQEEVRYYSGLSDGLDKPYAFKRTKQNYIFEPRYLLHVTMNPLNYPLNKIYEYEEKDNQRYFTENSTERLRAA